MNTLCVFFYLYSVYEYFAVDLSKELLFYVLLKRRNIYVNNLFWQMRELPDPVPRGNILDSKRLWLLAIYWCAIS